MRDSNLRTIYSYYNRYDILDFRKPNLFPYIWRKLSITGLR